MHSVKTYLCRPNGGLRALAVLSLVGALWAGLGYLAEATPLGQLADDGQALFQQKCSSCHTIGGGNSAGPDLKDVTARRDRDWLIRFIVAPDRLIAQKDPIATQLLQEYRNLPMPNMGVSDADAAALLVYLGSQGAAPSAQAAQAPAPARPQPAQAASGDPATGKALFSGTTAFQNGGAPCIACHSAGDAGAMGGGALGPDLTQAFNKFGGEAGIAPILAGLPFPTMKPIYEKRPLTPEEQASLGAFLKASAARQPVDSVPMVAVLALAVLAVLLTITRATWSRRLTSVRVSLIEQTRAKGGFTR